MSFSRPHCGVEKKLEVEKKTCRGRKQDGPIARSRKRQFGVEKKSSSPEIVRFRVCCEFEFVKIVHVFVGMGGLRIHTGKEGPACQQSGFVEARACG